MSGYVTFHHGNLIQQVNEIRSYLALPMVYEMPSNKDNQVDERFYECIQYLCLFATVKIYTTLRVLHNSASLTN